jgi:DNA/RNA-binding domain of Phe-tRNA-synthetase-like protein
MIRGRIKNIGVLSLDEKMINAMNNHRLTIQPEVLQRYPGYTCIVVYSEGMDNTGPAERSAEVMRQAEHKAAARFGGRSLGEHPHIASWRSAYQTFGAKPKKHPCSIEALLTRVCKQEPLPSINPIVNLYNAVSLEHVMPIGGEDRDKLTSDLQLAFAEGTETFDTRRSGVSTVEHPEAGEVVWKDSTGVTCRRWNWRQCERTALRTETHRGYFVFDCLPPFGLAEALAAARQFIDLAEECSPGVATEAEVLHEPEI